MSVRDDSARDEAALSSAVIRIGQVRLSWCREGTATQLHGLNCICTRTSFAMIDIEKVTAEFKDLKRRCQDIKIKNRKLVEAKGKPLVYSAQDLGDEDESGHEDESTKKASDVFNMTLAEFEAQKKAKVDKSAYSMAKLTYDKEIREIRDFKTGGEKSEKDRLSGLVNHLNKEAKDRYQVQKKKIERREKLAVSGFINDKNKQFNQLIDKQRDRSG